MRFFFKSQRIVQILRYIYCGVDDNGKVTIIITRTRVAYSSIRLLEKL